MAVLKLSPFGGMIPARDNRALPDQAASNAEDVFLGGGDLRGFRPETLIRTLTNPLAVYVFRVPQDPQLVNAGFGSSTWMEFTDADTTVLRSPITSDVYNRYYWASPSAAPRYNTFARIVTASASYILGIPAPGAAPTLNIVGGVSTVKETRAYVYTWVSAFGEEGPPSPPVTGTGPTDAAWNLTVGAPTLSNSTDRNLTLTRIYRTITAEGGSTTFFLVAEFAIATLSYSDVLPNSTVASKPLLQSTNWLAPPAGLRGMVQLPNGIFAGWVDSSIYFSEPYRPHAWPVAYSLTVDYPVIGLGVYGQSLIVCTTGYPVIISGTHPAQMSQANFPTLEPCMSRGSIVSTPSGVVYASPNGLILANSGGVKNVTEEIIYKETWLSDVNPSTIRAVNYEGQYIAFTGLPRAVAGKGFLIAPPPTAFGWINDPVATKNLIADFWSGQLMHIHSGGVYQLHPPATTGMNKYLWRSKEFQLPAPTNFAAAKVMFDIPSGISTLNPVPNDTLVQSLAADQYGLLRVYADNRLIFTREIRRSDVVFKLPSGFKATVWVFEIEARLIIYSLEVATSTRELGRV